MAFAGARVIVRFVVIARDKAIALLMLSLLAFLADETWLRHWGIFKAYNSLEINQWCRRETHRLQI
jgi:hypothetical protein